MPSRSAKRARRLRNSSMRCTGGSPNIKVDATFVRIAGEAPWRYDTNAREGDVRLLAQEGVTLLLLLQCGSRTAQVRSCDRKMRAFVPGWQDLSAAATPARSQSRAPATAPCSSFCACAQAGGDTSSLASPLRAARQNCVRRMEGMWVASLNSRFKYLLACLIIPFNHGSALM